MYAQLHIYSTAQVTQGKRDPINTQPRIQRAEVNQTNLHTQLHTYWTKQVTQEGSAGELEYEGDSDKHSQEIKH